MTLPVVPRGRRPARRGRCPRCGRDVALAVAHPGDGYRTRRHLHAGPYRETDVCTDRRGRKWCRGGMGLPL